MSACPSSSLWCWLDQRSSTLAKITRESEMEDTMLLTDWWTTASLSAKNCPPFSFLCLSFSIFLIISLERQHEALAEHDSVSSIYSQAVSSSSSSVWYTFLWRGRGYELKLFIWRGRQALPTFFPLFCSHCSEERLEEGWAGDKRENRTTRVTEYDTKMPCVSVLSYLSRFT